MLPGGAAPCFSSQDGKSGFAWPIEHTFPVWRWLARPDEWAGRQLQLDQAERQHLLDLAKAASVPQLR